MRLFRKPANDLAWYVVGACIAIYLLSAALSILQAPPAEPPIQYFFEPYIDSLIGIGMGGSLPLHQNEYWTLITSAYLHADIIHILFNCLCLLAFFPIISEQYGKPKGFVIYTIAGIAGSLLSAASGETYSLGASGGVFGLYGAIIAYGIRGKRPGRWAPVKEELLWVIANFAIGLSGVVNVSNAGHFGGLLGGLLAGLFVGPSEQEQTLFLKSRPALGALAVTIASLAIGLSYGARATYLAVYDRPAFDSIIAKRRSSELDQNIRQNPDNGALLTNRGLHKYQANDMEGAFADFSAAAALDPSATNLKNKGDALFALGRREEAVKIYSEVLEKEPENSGARFFRAESYRTLGKTDAAVEDYGQITTLSAPDADTYLMRAIAFHVLGNLDNALADYDKSIEMGNSDASVFIDRANIKFIKKDLDGAIADYDRAADLTPQDASIYLARAGCHTLNDNFEKAIVDYTQSIDKGTNNAEAWNGRAWSYFKLGRQQEAMADVEQALKIAPDYGYAFGTRAHIFEALGERDKAVADYRIALSRNPENTESQKALVRLGVQ